MSEQRASVHLHHNLLFADNKKLGSWDSYLAMRATLWLAPGVTRAELTEQLTRQVLAGPIADFGPVLLAQFVEAVRKSDKQRLTELARLVETARKPRKRG